MSLSIDTFLLWLSEMCLLIIVSLKSLRPCGIYINTEGPSTSTIAANHLDKKQNRTIK